MKLCSAAGDTDSRKTSCSSWSVSSSEQASWSVVLGEPASWNVASSERASWRVVWSEQPIESNALRALTPHPQHTAKAEGKYTKKTLTAALPGGATKSVGSAKFPNACLQNNEHVEYTSNYSLHHGCCTWDTAWQPVSGKQLQKGCLKNVCVYVYIYIVRTCLNQLQLVQKIPEASRAHWGRESVCLNQGSDSFRRILSHQHALRTIHTFSIVFPCSCCVLSVRAHGQQLTIPHISS